uniref:DUF1338 domain-containing protein n=1 Tax=Macrostomum lignano TaxID=282301 RepID=A0A1I8FM14_9PLAT
RATFDAVESLGKAATARLRYALPDPRRLVLGAGVLWLVGELFHASVWKRHRASFNEPMPRYGAGFTMAEISTGSSDTCTNFQHAREALTQTLALSKRDRGQRLDAHVLRHHRVHGRLRCCGRQGRTRQRTVTGGVWAHLMLRHAVRGPRILGDTKRSRRIDKILRSRLCLPPYLTPEAKSAATSSLTSQTAAASEEGRHRTTSETDVTCLIPKFTRENPVESPGRRFPCCRPRCLMLSRALPTWRRPAVLDSSRNRDKRARDSPAQAQASARRGPSILAGRRQRWQADAGHSDSCGGGADDQQFVLEDDFERHGHRRAAPAAASAAAAAIGPA